MAIEVPRRTKIVCTLGPATRDPAVLREMIISGLDVARLNFSHGAHEDHKTMYEMVRGLSRELGKPVSILQDLQGPKIRVGTFKEGPVELNVGDRFCITVDDIEGTQERVSTTYKLLAEDVRPGDDLLIDDGLLSLRVTEVDGNDVWTEVVVGGLLKNNKGINLPGAAVTAPSLTAKDKIDLKFGLELGVDYVALSFVRSPLDIHILRALMPNDGSAPQIISKIEKPQAIEELADIIGVSDGIMVARGDLGVELPPERVPMLQKKALAMATAASRLSITATQMLDSMTYNPRPTRAEASDVANAVMDGTDAVMLSGESAAGKYPIQAVRMMARIIKEVEGSEAYKTRELSTITNSMRDIPNAVARASTVAANEMGVRAIVVFTETGRSARLLTTYRPSREIFGCTPNPETLYRMGLYWGVTPIHIARMQNTDELILAVERTLCRQGRCKPGDEIIIMLGTPIATGAETNLIKFHRISEHCLQND